MTESRIQAVRCRGVQSHPAGAGDLRRPRHPAVRLPQARQPALVLSARVGAGRRALRALLLHRPAGRDPLRSARARLCSEYRRNRLVQQSEHEDPLEFVRACQARFRAALPSGLPRFCGGLVGFFGYDTVRYIEPRLARTVQAGRRAGRPGHPAAAVRAARRGRQPVGQALPHRLCRSARAGRLRAGAGAPAGAGRARCGSRSRCRRSGLPRPA